MKRDEGPLLGPSDEEGPSSYDCFLMRDINNRYEILRSFGCPRKIAIRKLIQIAENAKPCNGCGNGNCTDPWCSKYDSWELIDQSLKDLLV